MGGALRRHSILGRNLAIHLQHGGKHVHESNHEGIVLFEVRSLNFLAVINVKQHVMGWASDVMPCCVC